MESSGIGASLHKVVTASARHLLCLSILTYFLSGSAADLGAQRPVPHRSDSSELPRFTLREILAGRNDTLARIPGPWDRAASAAVSESLLTTAYRRAATRSGLVPLQGRALASERSQHVMGLFRRAELHAAVHRTLADLRATIPSDTVRARFDRLFRPRGEWIADLHDAALSWARLRVPGITWGSARRALAGIHWLPPGDSLPANEAVPRALYGLTVMAAMDSDGFERVRAELQRSDSASAVVVLLLLTGYAESQKWYVDALEFFLIQPWIPGGKRARSLADLVGDYWRAAGTGATGSEAAVPEIHARLFGHPQAVPQYGVPQALFDRLVRVENPSARAWLERYGEAGLLRTLRRLPVGDTALVLLQTRDEAIRLTTIPRQSRESLNGFLEPRDAIAIDPGYSPLLALGTVVHEWQHLLFRQRQLAGFASGLSGPSPTIIALPGVEPYLAEGFAEWSTELIMAPVVARWPLLSLGELQKRAGLARNGPDDQHAIGYALVRALAEALSDPGITTSLLLRHAESPSSIVGHPTLRRAWNRHALAPERVMAIPADRILIPEVTFSVEDGFPEVISSRILVPPSGRGDH